jgi:ribonuclease-3
VEPKLKQLEQKLNIHFKQPELLELALIHPSYLSEHPEVKEHNQRLEFLGDAVLGAAVAYYLYQKYPESAEGNLTKTRAAVVCEASLAALAQDLELGEYICLGRGEASSGGKERASILADAFEAVIAAIFLDQGWEKVCNFLWSLLGERVENTVHLVEKRHPALRAPTDCRHHLAALHRCHSRLNVFQHILSRWYLWF